MPTTIQLRRGTASQWSAANPVLANGEAGWATDTKQLKIGDGASAWDSLPDESKGPVHASADNSDSPKDLQGVNDLRVAADTSGGAVTLNLPDNPTVGDVIHIMDVGFSVGLYALTVRGGPYDIDQSESLPDAMVVEEAGDDSVNRTYIRDGSYSGFPKYETIDSSVKIEAAQDESEPDPQPLLYAILKEDGEVLGTIVFTRQYESNELATELEGPEDATWGDTGGGLPLPTVRYATWADIDAAGIDRSTVSLLEESEKIIDSSDENGAAFGLYFTGKMWKIF